MAAWKPNHRAFPSIARTADAAQRQEGRAQDGGGARGPRSRWGQISAMMCTLAVAVVCNTGPAITSITMSVAPAALLTISVRFQGALIQSANVGVVVGIYDDTQHLLVTFTGHQRLTVNGVKPDHIDAGVQTFTVPRQTAGGSYTIAYIDDTGRQTTLFVPAPTRDLAITSPAPQDHIAIPTPGQQIATQYVVPYPASSALARLPFSTQIAAVAEGTCNGYQSHGTPATAPFCVNVSTSQQLATGSAVIDTDSQDAREQLSQLAPGPGELYLHMTVTGPLPQPAFASVDIVLDDAVTIPITWD